MSRFAAFGFAAIASLVTRSVLAEPNAFLARTLRDLPLKPRFTMVSGPPPGGARVIAPGISVIEGDPIALAWAHPELDVEVHPPLQLKLDVSLPFIGATVPRAEGLDGKGTYIGIVDTGADITHRTFRNADGTSRIAWFLDMSGTPRPGNADDKKYGGRIWSKSELDAILTGTVVENGPGDNDGHGTHVAAIAAGNGGPAKQFVGVAPGAELVIVRAIGRDGGIEEGAAILGTQFVFDRAAEVSKPAVVNLSLGTQYGAHDGTSTFERGLVALTGKGRSIVVAASNEGAFPIHTSVRVTPGVPYRIPIRLRGADGNGAKYTGGQVYIWINARDRGALKVSVRDRDGDYWLEGVEKGHAFAREVGPKLKVTISNEILDTLDSRETSGATVWLTGGELPVGDFELELEGDTATEIWLQGNGQAIDGPGMPLFVRGGQIEGTIGVPASAAGLISIGSVSTRTSYTNGAGKSVPVESSVIGERSYFSSSGPAANGALRPDVLAPGHFVISAMARSAFLAVPDGQFGSDQIINTDFAALAGTSMSSPFGAGAIALLFQRDPSLTHEDARALLQAGARPLADDPREGGSVRDYAKGAGILDIEGALLAHARKGAPPRASSLFLRLGASYLAADGGLPLHALVLARDAAGRPADAEFTVACPGATVTPVDHPAVGLYRFALRAQPGLGGRDATIKLTGALSLTRTVPIAADRWDARDGIRSGGGCSTAGHQSSPALFAIAILTIPGILRARSRARARAARRDGTAAADRRY